MTIKSDLLAQSKTISESGNSTLMRDLNRQVGDLGYQDAALEGVDEVQTIDAGDRTGGTMELDFTLASGETFSTAALAWNAAAATVETAIDTAAAAVVGWTDGDIAVSGGAFGAAGSDTIFTFSGASVTDQDHGIIVVDGASLTGGAADPAPAQTTLGSGSRPWFAALKAMGVIMGTDPTFGAAPAGQYTVNQPTDIEQFPNEQSVRDLLEEITLQEGQDWSTEILTLLGWPISPTK
jgi:hypothetical protein